MFNGSGWIIAAVVLAIILIFVTRSGGGVAGREKRRLAAEADRLIAQSILRDDDAAMANLARGMNLAQRAGDGLLSSEAASRLGDIYMKRQQYSEAVRVYEQALGFKQNPGWHTEKPNFEALLQRCLAEAHQKAGDNGETH